MTPTIIKLLYFAPKMSKWWIAAAHPKGSIPIRLIVAGALMLELQKWIRISELTHIICCLIGSLSTHVVIPLMFSVWAASESVVKRWSSFANLLDMYLSIAAVVWLRLIVPSQCLVCFLRSATAMLLYLFLCFSSYTECLRLGRFN